MIYYKYNMSELSRGLSAKIGPGATSVFDAGLTTAGQLPEQIKAADLHGVERDAMYAFHGDLSDQQIQQMLSEYIDLLSRNMHSFNDKDVKDALIRLSKLPTTPRGKKERQKVNPSYIKGIVDTINFGSKKDRRGLSKISTWLVTTCTVAVSACGSSYLFNLILKIATKLSELIYTFGVKSVYKFLISILNIAVTTIVGAPCLSATIFTVVACVMSMIYYKYRVGIQTVGAQELRTLKNKMTTTPPEPEQIQAVETAVKAFYKNIKKIPEIKRNTIVRYLSGMDEEQIEKLFKDLRNETPTEVFEKFKAGKYHNVIALVNKVLPDLKEFLKDLKKIAEATDDLVAQLHGYNVSDDESAMPDATHGGSSRKSSRKSRKSRKTIRKKVSKSMKRTFKKTRRQRR